MAGVGTDTSKGVQLLERIPLISNEPEGLVFAVVNMGQNDGPPAEAPNSLRTSGGSASAVGVVTNPLPLARPNPALRAVSNNVPCS